LQEKQRSTQTKKNCFGQNKAYVRKKTKVSENSTKETLQEKKWSYL